jgi:cupin fold WbuC family metalloprotein
MKLRKINDEVFVAPGPIIRLGGEDVDFLKRQASLNPRGRARICAHSDNEDAVHEMVIAISSSSYIRPHRHIGKSESFHIVEGSVDIVMFDDGGGIADVIELGDRNSGRDFFYRLSESRFHMPLSRTDVLVIHEVTNGPFDRNRTIFAPFAPAEDQIDEVRRYMSKISATVAQVAGSRRRISGSQ